METINCINSEGKRVVLPKDKFRRRPSAYALVVNEGKVLLLKHKKTGKFWLPGGGLEAGEDASTAAVRETKEETGLTVRAKGSVASLENPYYDDIRDDAFIGEIEMILCKPADDDTGPTLGAEDEDIAEAQWVEADTLGPDDFHDIGGKLAEIIKKNAAK